MSRERGRQDGDDQRRAEWQSFLQEIEELQGSLTRQCVACLRYWVDPAERWWMYLDDEDRPILYCVDCAVR